MFGHSVQLNQLKMVLSSKPNTILLDGPSYLGKFSFSLEYIQSICSDLDIFVCEDGIESIRQAITFSRDEPYSSDFKVILIRDGDQLSESAQDALLKLSEEPPPNVIILITSSNPGRIQPALLSRIRHRISFQRLSKEDMKIYTDSHGITDEFAIEISSGIPGLYNIICASPEIRTFYELVKSVLEGNSSTLLNPVPPIFEKCKDNHKLRDAVVHIVLKAVRSNPLSVMAPFISKFASSISSVNSSSMELHWARVSVRTGQKV